jgi:hypothetical protein
MMKPSVHFWKIRNIDSHYVRSTVDMHHLSWAAPKDIYKKVTNYAHATDFNGDEWYRTHYASWDASSKVAVLPTGSYGVIEKPLPQELRECLKHS